MRFFRAKCRGFSLLKILFFFILALDHRLFSAKNWLARWNFFYLDRWLLSLVSRFLLNGICPTSPRNFRFYWAWLLEFFCFLHVTWSLKQSAPRSLSMSAPLLTLGEEFVRDTSACQWVQIKMQSEIKGNPGTTTRLGANTGANRTSDTPLLCCRKIVVEPILFSETIIFKDNIVIDIQCFRTIIAHFRNQVSKLRYGLTANFILRDNYFSK
jgi:hypothetical protein